MRTYIAALALAALATPAFAASSWTATPAQAASKAGFAGKSVIWSCDTSGCHSTSDVSEADELTECKALAHELGTLTAFSGRTGPITAARLSKCNAAAPKTKA